MYNRYIPNPDGSYQKQRVFESGQVEQTETVPAWTSQGDGARLSKPQAPSGPAGGLEQKPGKSQPSEGKLNISMDDLLVLAVLLLLLLDEEDDQLLIVLAALAFLIL